MGIVRAFAIILLLGFALLNGFGAQEPAQSSEPAFSSIVVEPDEDYRLGPSDVVEVYILKVPELSREYRVSANGTIEMPFLGRIKAQKKTSQELAMQIADGLRNGYLVDPQVSVLAPKLWLQRLSRNTNYKRPTSMRCYGASLARTLPSSRATSCTFRRRMSFL